MPAALTEDDVVRAAGALVAAFAATDTEAYFAAFAEDATFVFHTEPRRLEDRAAYEALWRSWLDAGWRVLECRSTAARVQVLGSVGVFTHDVRTTVRTPEGPETTHEQETIVFARRDSGSLLAVHEHLSPAVPPTTSAQEGR
ncbi:YybH family protein [Kocuria turfanensis]|uniref:YybH family protein n=1 Tax=Kocuria turfanensis TaxID=388357 RepID=UPI004035E51B